MIRDHFRVMVVNLGTGRAEVQRLDRHMDFVGGSGLAAGLFQMFGHPDRPWNDPDQPLIFAIGPLTGLFPLMSKTVCGFKSPYHDQYSESHAGGRSALCLRFASLDALVIKGVAPGPSYLSVGSRHVAVKDASFLWGQDALTAGKTLRRFIPGSGHRSILRIGVAGENLSSMACINVDSNRHFGRMGSGSVMGAKNLKAIALHGDRSFKTPGGKEYNKLFADVYSKLTASDIMNKYHNLGTAGNVAALNELKSLPWRNLQQSSDPGVEGITGEKFADDTLLRNSACAGCPVGCIHVGFVREKFQEDNRYIYRQVPYDYEHLFSVGSMLGMTDAFEVLKIVDEVEKTGLDVMSSGVALAWATEALERGLISTDQTIVPLKFGSGEGYRRAVWHLARADNEFYRLLTKGTMHAAREYGGEDFACVLGQEMAGYATGEVFFVSESLGFRHSHLDSGGYSWDQKTQDQDVDAATNFLVDDERHRVLVCCMVGCLFARAVFTNQMLSDALACVGHDDLAQDLPGAAKRVQKLRWQVRVSTGYNPEKISIPKRYTEVVTWKGPVDPEYMEKLRVKYAGRIMSMARDHHIHAEGKKS